MMYAARMSGPEAGEATSAGPSAASRRVKLRSGGEGGSSEWAATLPGDHHVDVAAAALRAHQPGAPIGHRRLRSVPARLLAGVGFAAVAARFAPHHKPDVSR